MKNIEELKDKLLEVTNKDKQDNKKKEKWLP